MSPLYNKKLINGTYFHKYDITIYLLSINGRDYYYENMNSGFSSISSIEYIVCVYLENENISAQHVFLNDMYKIIPQYERKWGADYILAYKKYLKLSTIL